MWISRNKYEQLQSNLRIADTKLDCQGMEIKYQRLEIKNQKDTIDYLERVVKAQEDTIAKLEAKDIKIVNEQSKKFIEVEHASIKAMNEALPKLRKQGWSDKLKVKIQGDKVFTVHEREVKEGK
ncbi:hypothetical protein MARVELLAND_164 [Bacillus phage vB_BspM_MarvelLand]|nr:hypothetical protein MARVELLAND_164 [Bacillus phage vB_BspM_MarvelLand]